MTVTETEPTVTSIAFHGPPRPKYFIKIRSHLFELLRWQRVNGRQAQKGKNLGWGDKFFCPTSTVDAIHDDMPRICHSGRCWQADTVCLVSVHIGLYVMSRLAPCVLSLPYTALCKGRLGCRLGLLLLLVMVHCSELDYTFRYLIEFQFTGTVQFWF